MHLIFPNKSCPHFLRIQILLILNKNRLPEPTLHHYFSVVLFVAHSLSPHMCKSAYPIIENMDDIFTALRTLLLIIICMNFCNLKRIFLLQQFIGSILSGTAGNLKNISRYRDLHLKMSQPDMIRNILRQNI